MTTKIKDKDANASAKEKNDWNDGDEWDEWGDAVDNIQQEETAIAKSETVSPVKPNTNTEYQNNSTNKNELQNAKEKIYNKTVEATETQTPTEAQANKSSWGSVWGSFSSVLSTATEGLGNITTTVSQGINQVIGVPDPEELARINAQEVAQQEQTKAENVAEKVKTTTDENATNAVPVFGMNIVSGVTTLGSKVLNTGLDTLEGIGKKTMDILQENDPLLMNKRKMLGLKSDGPNLSELLQEAKKESDEMEKTLQVLKINKFKEEHRFEVLFENSCGLVHLEALQILSRESTIKIKALMESVSGNALADLQETINEVKELMELEDLEGDSEGDYDGNELHNRLKTALEDADLPITFDEIVSYWTQSLEWISTNAENASAEEAYNKSVCALSETCALEMSKLHKIGELMLVKEHHSTANEVDGIVQLCKHFHMHLKGLTMRFATTISAKGNEESKKLVSALFAEMYLALQQIEKALNLFLPIIQIGAV